MGFMDAWNKGVAAGTQQRQSRTLRELFQPALSGDANALAGLHKEGLHEQAMQAQAYAGQQQKAQAEAAADRVKELSMLGASDERMAQQVYPEWRAEMLKRMPNLQIPEVFEPSAIKAMQGIAGIKAPEMPVSYREFELGQKNPAFADYIAAKNAPKPNHHLIETDTGWAWLQEPGTGAPQPNVAGPSGGASTVMGGALERAVEQVESGGNPHAVSPRGALGPMQTMPGTLRDPGFGVAPARDGSVDEQRRVGRDYLGVMTQKYGLVGGLAAYNWGPGNWEAALQRAGGDPQRALMMAPRETREYVPKVLSQYQGGSAGNAGVIPVTGVQPKPRTGRDAPSGYQWTPQGTLAPIPGGPADRKNNPLPADMAKDERQMRRELADVNKEPRQILDAYKRVEAAARNPNAASDIALIFGYMKMLDPGSVVREGEFANAQNAAGIPDRIVNVYNKAMQGERLNPKQRAQFVAEARKIRDIAFAQSATREMEYGEMAEDYGYDPKRATGSDLATPQARQRFQQAQTMLQDARDAIRRGAPRDAVKRRLIEQGFTNIAGRL